ncbi:MAG: dihydroorotase family protein [Thermoplasmata archaeon]
MSVLTITDCKAVIDGELLECEIQIENEKIVEIKKVIHGEKGVVLSARGLIVIPGLIDVHAHILDPVIPSSNFKNASEMALLGGVTTVLEMPTDKPTLSKNVVLEKLERAKREAIVDFGFHAGNYRAGCGAEIHKLKGFLKAIKGFLCSPYQIDNLEEFFTVADEAGLLPMLHCEDEAVLREAAGKLDGKELKPSDYPMLRPSQAEKIAVERALSTATDLNAPLHIVHLSSKEGVEVLRKHKVSKISAEVCPHHLVFTRKDLEEKGALLKMNPPLREKEDVETLWHALISGLVDCVSTDHFYTPQEEKQKPIESAPAGIPGLEALCPLIYTYGVKKRGMSMARFVEVVTGTQAKKFGLYQKGRIEKGMDADLVLLNPKVTKKFRSKYWSPYEGMELTGYPEIVILRGSVVMEHGEVCGKPGSGKFVFGP